MPRILLTLTVLLTAIAVAAGCGSDGAPPPPAPHRWRPAGSLIYGEATLGPEGDQQAAIDALVAKFPGEGSAGDRIRGLMEKAFSESDTGLSYAEDVEPWLGDEAGFFVSSLDPGAAAAPPAGGATEDEDAQRRDREGGQDERQDRALQGPRLLHVRRRRRGGRGRRLGRARQRRRLQGRGRHRRGRRPDRGRRALHEDARGRPRGAARLRVLQHPGVRRAAAASSAAARRSARSPELFEDPVLATLNANEHGVRFEATLPESLARRSRSSARAARRGAELPADSWLALAQPDLGKTIGLLRRRVRRRRRRPRRDRAAAQGRDRARPRRGRDRPGWATGACSCAAPRWPS